MCLRVSAVRCVCACVSSEVCASLHVYSVRCVRVSACVLSEVCACVCIYTEVCTCMSACISSEVCVCVSVGVLSEVCVCMSACVSSEVRACVCLADCALTPCPLGPRRPWLPGLAPGQLCPWPSPQPPGPDEAGLCGHRGGRQLDRPHGRG